MIYVEYINGNKDTFESAGKRKIPWKYNKHQECYIVKTINGTLLIPREAVQSICHIKI